MDYAVGYETEYYESGIKKEYGKYLTSKGTVFDPVKDKKKVENDDDGILLISHHDYRIISFWDSTGRQTLTDGTGEAIYFSEGKKTKERHYLDSRKHGICFEYFTTTGKISNQAEYKNGELIKGISYDSVGTEYPYTVEEQMPEFPGGEEALMSYIAHNIKYPTSAMENEISGKVIVEFVVDKNGKIIKPKIVKSLNPDCDKEVIRVLRSMPAWTPGKQRGIPVRVSYKLPVKFTLK